MEKYEESKMGEHGEHREHEEHGELFIPKIDTNQINGVLKDLVSSFKMVQHVHPLWICGRSKNFGFRPSLEKNYLPKITEEWVSFLEKGFVVITPLVFYTCSAEDIEKLSEERNNQNFLVYNHYNVLISYIDKFGKIVIERYEPSDSTKQGILQKYLSQLICENLKKYTQRTLHFQLVAPQGLQAIYGDNQLCGHHIIYWTIYRLKYGLKASVNMLSDSKTGKRFEQFCRCITDFRLAKCLDLSFA